MKFLVFCKHLKQQIDSFHMRPSFTPYYVHCPHCGQQKMVRLTQINKGKHYFVRFKHFVIPQKSLLLDKILDLGYELQERDG